mgnify:CR=1 FL=1
MRYFIHFLIRLILLIGVPATTIYFGAQYYVANARYVSTENAYVKANLISVSAGVSGYVTRMQIAGNQRVRAGQLLFTIDDEPFRIEVARASAAIAQVRNTILAARAAYFEVQADLEEALEQVKYNRRLFERQEKLAKRGIATGSKYEEAENELALAKRRVRTLRERVRGALADLGGDINLAIEQHPMHVEAQAVHKAAESAFRHTLVYAPISGIVGKISLQQGEYVEAGRPLFPIVQTGNLWVEANLKETQLTYVTLGQRVSVVADTYPDHIWHATITSISPSTGAEVAILPPQNASGNWVKVVQRIPVKINIDSGQHAVQLRPGMTVTVRIDTEREVKLIDLVDSALAWTMPNDAQQ